MASDLIGDSARRLFAQHDAPGEGWPTALWQSVEDAGFPLALLTEDEGGFGLPPQEAVVPLRIAAGHAAPLPLAEAMAANWLLAKAGLPLAEGPAALLPASTRRVPWGRALQVLVRTEAAPEGLRVTRIAAPTGWTHGTNIAGEPRDDLAAPPSGPAATVPLDPDVPHALMALLRVQQMAGAMEAILALSVRYAAERVQFGKPIARFQIIQQYLATMAGEAAAAGAAADMAAGALPLATADPARFTLLAGAAKLRCGEAAGQVADLAHQIHGAIGFSREYPLHPLTRRLWSWRDEAGREADWAPVLGAALLADRAEGLWPQITAMQSGFL